MLPRTRIVLAVAAAVLIIALGGCDLVLLYPGTWDVDQVRDPALLTVVRPGGDSYDAGEIVEIEWEGNDRLERLDIDLYLAGQYLQSIAHDVANTGRAQWQIPTEFSVDNEIFTEYAIVVSGLHPDQNTGTLRLVATSEEFTIVPAASGGLSDVTVNQRLIDVTLVDNGQEIDGDTIDLYLNGELVIAGHTLAALPGTTFALTLQEGPNLFEVVALNEGSVSPNTAQLTISNVVAGESVQQWRLLTGETGTLTITAP